MSKQLPLDFKHQSNQSFDDYFSGENEEVVSHLKQCSDKKGEPFIFVWGPSGTGKTHLLQACCQQTAQTGDNTFYLELKSG
ncbi:MAG: ATP-binding protein, partial [Methylococcales bacterium]|nr:ATP-binding protein [Methylococcales bacterium]